MKILTTTQEERDLRVIIHINVNNFMPHAEDKTKNRILLEMIKRKP